MQAGNNYSKLLELARENSSEKRRELLNDVTDLFFVVKDTQSPLETNMFGELLAKVASELSVEVRRELSARFGDGSAPRRLAVSLANDTDLNVAAPILQTARSLTQEDLIAVVHARGDAHRMLVTKRKDVGEALSDALVQFGDDRVVASLIKNETARVSHETFDKIVDRAISSPYLQQPLVSRQAISPEHLNKLFLSADTLMRAQILERNAQFSEAEINEAMARAKTRIAVDHGALPADYEAAEREIRELAKRGALTGATLPNLWRDKKDTHFKMAFARLTGLHFNQTTQLFGNKDVDGIAMVARAAGFDRALFVTLAVMVLGQEGMSAAKSLGEMYNGVPQEAAQRALRFMKLRAGTMAQAA
jgi:uncharacterized protein (DUF2336 family)